MGFSTLRWGPSCWIFLYTAALNHHYNKNPGIDDKYIAFFENLAFVLPCEHCVDYYSMLLKAYPIRDFLDLCEKEKIDYALFTWLYYIKDKVNQKLIRQENECYNKEVEKIKRTKLSTKDKINLMQMKKEYILYTQASPDFDEVLAKYMSFKSDCTGETNQALKSCRHLPKELFS